MRELDPSLATSSSSRRLPTRRIGRFVLLSELGRGAMGVVYHARDASSELEVALKLALVRMDATRLLRFQREGQVTAALRHPGIVGIHAMGVAEGRPYLAYELIEGARPLDEVARGLPLGRRVELVRDVARALGHAHQRGVVHRDVKPQNVLVDLKGRARVADFGLALAIEHDRLTQTGALVGTLGYMAPEQLKAQRGQLGPPTDVWALGVMLSEVLTGESPFPAASLALLLQQVTEGSPVPPRRVDPSIPAPLEAIVLRALQRDPGSRYVDGEELARDLDRFLEGERVAGSSCRRAPPRGRRRALALAGATFGGVTLIALVLVATWPAPTPRPSPAPSVAGGLASGQTTHRSTDPELAPDAGAPADTPLFMGQDARAQPAAARSFAARGKEALDAGRYDEALTAFTRALELDPSSAAETLVLRALTHLRREGWTAAERDADQALALDATLAEAWLHRGAARANQGRADEAVADATRALELSPRLEEALLVRAGAHRTRGDLPAARADCDALLAQNPYNADALALRVRLRAMGGDLSGAFADLDRAIEVVGERGDLLELRGSLHGVKGDLERAIADLGRAVERGHDTANLRLNRSITLTLAGRLRAALGDADRAIELAPTDATMWTNRAHVRMRLGDPLAAIEDARYALELDPQAERAHANLGFALARLDRDAEAVKAFDRALELNPDNDAALLERALARARLGDEDGALADLTRSLELAPGSANAHLQRGILRADRGDLEGAIADHTQAIELSATLALAYYHRGAAYARQGDEARARADWQRTLAEVAPDDPLVADVRRRLRALGD